MYLICCQLSMFSPQHNNRYSHFVRDVRSDDNSSESDHFLRAFLDRIPPSNQSSRFHSILSKVLLTFFSKLYAFFKSSNLPPCVDLFNFAKHQAGKHPDGALYLQAHILMMSVSILEKKYGKKWKLKISVLPSIYGVCRI